MELTVQPVSPQAVVWNKGPLMAAVMALASKYDGLVVSDKADAKRDRAEINRILREIDDTRKAVKRQYEAPLKAFEADLKSIVAPLQDAGAKIDAQIKAIEAEEREARLALLREAFEATGAHVFGLERVMSPAWLNASTSESKAVRELNAAVAQAESDVKAIHGMQNPHEAALLVRYAEGATLAEVFAYAAKLAAAPAVEATDAQPTAPMPEENPLNTYTLTDQGVVVTATQNTYTLTLTCSPARLQAVCDFMDRLGVFFVVD